MFHLIIPWTFGTKDLESHTLYTVKLFEIYILFQNERAAQP